MALCLRSVSKAFGGFQAVRDVRLSVEEGEFVTILGPSGSGKTTLLNLIAGFELPDQGEVLLRDRDITDLPANRRDIGMVFQNYALFPHMTVQQNVAFPLRMRRLPAREVATKAAAAIKLVNLSGMAGRLPRELSGGQQQRVALARAIVFEPRMLLLDEPFSALDRRLRESISLEVRQLQRRLGLTTLFITHDQGEALTMSDRILVMNHGHTEQFGTPSEIYEQPANAFVAHFLGESNIVHGRVAAVREGWATVQLGEATIKVSAGALRTGEEAACLIRPERVEVGGSRTGAVTDTGTVTETVYHGSSVALHLHLPCCADFLIRAPVGVVTGEVGAALGFFVPPEAVHVLPTP